MLQLEPGPAGDPERRLGLEVCEQPLEEVGVERDVGVEVDDHVGLGRERRDARPEGPHDRAAADCLLRLLVMHDANPCVVGRQCGGTSGVRSDEPFSTMIHSRGGTCLQEQARRETPEIPASFRAGVTSA